jgi:hypothetical protein
MKFFLSIFLVLAAAAPAGANKKPVQDCKVSFGFAYIDRLDNNYRGIQGKQLKQVQDKLKKYGDVCYTSDDTNADYIFFVSHQAGRLSWRANNEQYIYAHRHEPG